MKLDLVKVQTRGQEEANQDSSYNEEECLPAEEDQRVDPEKQDMENHLSILE